MTKKKSDIPAGKKPMTVISIKTTCEFRDWLAEMAQSERITLVQFIEKATVEYGERKGLGKAPRRTAR